MGAGQTSRTQKELDRRMAWWREAKFGMFIHWGLYATPAGVWKDKEIEGIGEWIMKRAQIPVAEYEALARQFNPVKFNAEQWAGVAKSAGMKYLVITSKHHDGFAMFHSQAAPYNIVEATPFRRDPMKELAEACRKAGLRLCFYYSHVQDWHHPDAVGNDWDYPDESKKDFARYMKQKGLPQVRELLTQYGPIGLIWYDTPINITREHSQEFADLVRSRQPDCIVSGRVGNDLGDYVSMGDNRIPPGRVEGHWETPATLNDTWGFKKNDHNWKSTKRLLHLLVDIAGKGGNYLLNVGPTAEGLIPRASVTRLEEMGRWLKVNGEAIYGTTAGPFRYEQEWGRITAKPGKLYLHVFQWPRKELALYGLKNKVKKAYLLADKRKKPLPVVQEYNRQADLRALRLGVPAKAPDKNVSVIALEIQGKPRVDDALLEQPSGRIVLDAALAQMHQAQTGPQAVMGRFHNVEKWFNAKTWFSWEFKVMAPGAFDVALISAAERTGAWEGGHEVKIAVARQSLKAVVKDDGRIQDPKAPTWWTDVVSKLGRVTIAKPGVHTLSLKPLKLVRDRNLGLKLRSLRLTRVS